MKVTKVIRKKHPRVRSVEDNGSLTYVIDCRAMSFYHGRKIQQFTSKEACLLRVAEIEQIISITSLQLASLGSRAFLDLYQILLSVQRHQLVQLREPVVDDLQVRRLGCVGVFVTFGAAVQTSGID
jgi:hypothetical protein